MVYFSNSLYLLSTDRLVYLLNNLLITIIKDYFIILKVLFIIFEKFS